MGAPARLSSNTSRKPKTLPNLRWYVCGLLFWATTVNYIDRQVLGILKPVLTHEMHWSETDYGWVVSAFQAAYAVMMPVAGRVLDWLGTRIGYALAVAVWSAAAMCHALAHTLVEFAAARFALGLGEAANFPAAIKTIANWFPKRERALATGIFNSGTNIGALVAPLLVPLVATHFGWRASFLVTGGLDVLWIVVWLATYRTPQTHPRLSAEELALIESDQDQEPPRRVPYTRLLHTRAAWAFLIGKFMTDPVWWFYLYWLPGFLHQKYSLDLTHLGPPLIAVYLFADFGSVGGGWLSSRLLARGFAVGRARKVALLVCALAVVPVCCVMFAGGKLWLTVGLVGLAAAAHQGWSANLFTIPSDTFPRSTVASVVGLGGFGGAIAGMLVAPAVGRWLDFSHEAYGPLFVIASGAYLCALLVIHLLLPKFQQVNV